MQAIRAVAVRHARNPVPPGPGRAIALTCVPIPLPGLSTAIALRSVWRLGAAIPLTIALGICWRIATPSRAALAVPALRAIARGLRRARIEPRRNVGRLAGWW